MASFKTIHVVAAVIRQDGLLFATLRGYGDMAGKWEFPGGKVEPGEREAEALCREIREELNTEIRVGPQIGVVEYDYSNFHLSMVCYLCEIQGGQPQLLEHMAARWVSLSELDAVDWLPADRIILPALKEMLSK